MVRASYGKFKVVVNGETVIDGGKAAFLGIVPSAGAVLSAVRDNLEARKRTDAESRPA